ncbi:MAG: hypothetical protein IJ463_05350 [Bacilli bacterium]|nr:hypothetical protein [Bacilli bacterium]
MIRLDWITWKTEESELINPEEIVEKLKVRFQDYNSYMNPVVNESIKYEVENGGLNKNAFIINDRSPANEVANKIMSDIQEVKDMTNALIESVRLESQEQRKREVNQLILKIEEKIEKDKKLIENSKDVQQKYLQSSLEETSENIQTIIEITRKRINLLTRKLESLNRK